MLHTRREIYRALRDAISSDAAQAAVRDRALFAAASAQAGSGQLPPVNGYWDDDGEWREFFTFGIVGFGDGGLA